MLQTAFNVRIADIWNKNAHSSFLPSHNVNIKMMQTLKTIYISYNNYSLNSLNLEGGRRDTKKVHDCSQLAFATLILGEELTQQSLKSS